MGVYNSTMYEKLKSKRIRSAMVNRVSTSEVYIFIISFSGKNGYAPSITDIKDHFNFRSRNSAVKAVKRLEKKSMIEKDPIGRIKFPEILRK